MSALITVKNLSKFYRVGSEKVRALVDINLEIHKGEICCILGTSGSGKSTLLNQLAGLEKPTNGSVYIGKTNISRLTKNQLAGFRQRNVGFVFQSYNLLASMTAAENVAMPLLFRGVDKTVREREAATMLKKVGLGNRMRHRPSEMSGGQQQRVGIARAFVAKPKIVFADEPTGNLDSRTTLEVMRLLVEMSHVNGITFVLVTHDNELANYADRIITLRDGVVISDKKNDHPAYLESVEDAEKRLNAAIDGQLSTKSLPSVPELAQLPEGTKQPPEERAPAAQAVGEPKSVPEGAHPSLDGQQAQQGEPAPTPTSTTAPQPIEAPTEGSPLSQAELHPDENKTAEPRREAASVEDESRDADGLDAVPSPAQTEQEAAPASKEKISPAFLKRIQGELLRLIPSKQSKKAVPPASQQEGEKKVER